MCTKKVEYMYYDMTMSNASLKRETITNRTNSTRQPSVSGYNGVCCLFFQFGSKKYLKNKNYIKNNNNENIILTMQVVSTV